MATAKDCEEYWPVAVIGYELSWIMTHAVTSRKTGMEI